MPTSRTWVSKILDLIKIRYTQAGATKKFIGQDYMGNKYYELYRPNASRPHQRHFDRPEILGVDKVLDILDRPPPPAWDAWLRFRRRTPPSPEEVQEGVDYFNMQQELATRNKAQDDEQRREEYPEAKPFKETDGPHKHTSVDDLPKTERGFPKLPLER